MADAGARLDARDGRRFDAGADESRAAARDEQVNQAVCRHKLVRALPRGVRHQIHEGFRQADGAQALVHSRNNGCGRTVCLFPAAQDADIAAFEGEHRRVRGNVRAAFVDNGDDTHRNRSFADHKSIGPFHLSQNFPNRVRELRDLPHTVRHGGDPVLCQAQAVEHDA